MGKKADPGAGDVPLTLDGEELVLRPSLEACRAISKLAGESLAVAVGRVMERLDFEFIVEVVALGLGESSPNIKKQIAEKIYRQGVITVAANVVQYIRSVMNGGRRPDDDPFSHSLELLDRLLKVVPEGMESEAAALEGYRKALFERMLEAGEETTDPLAVNGSPSENTTVS
jgi:hypothetical protein